MLEQPIPDNGQSVGNPAEVRSENIQKNQDFAGEIDQKTEQNTDGLQNSGSNVRSVFNAKQAATYLNRDEKTIRNWIASGRIHAEKVNGNWQITKAELDAAFVAEQRKREQETEREKTHVRSDTRSSKTQERSEKTEQADSGTERKTEQENSTPIEARSDSADSAGESPLVQQLKFHITGQDRRLEEKDMRLAEMKSGYERQLNEKDERLNEKDDRINDLKSDREQDRQMYTKLMNNAQELIHSLQTQVAQLEAPKQPVISSAEAVDGDYQESGGREVPAEQEAEQGTEEQEQPRRRWWKW